MPVLLEQPLNLGFSTDFKLGHEVRWHPQPLQFSLKQQTSKFPRVAVKNTKRWLWRQSRANSWSVFQGSRIMKYFTRPSKTRHERIQRGREKSHLQIPQLLLSHDILEDVVRMNKVVTSFHRKEFTEFASAFEFNSERKSSFSSKNYECTRITPFLCLFNPATSNGRNRNDDN
jgi:hypothetical protein